MTVKICSIDIADIYFFLLSIVSHYEYIVHVTLINCRRAMKDFLHFLHILHLFLPVGNAQSWRYDRVDLTSSDVALICSIRLCGVPLIRGTSLTGASIHASSLRGKRASARLLSSLPHYSIMMACGVCRTPSALPSQRRPSALLLSSPLFLLFFLFLALLTSSFLSPPAVLFSGIFLPHPFSPSHSSVDPSWFMFLQLPPYGESTERHAYTSLWRWRAWYYALEPIHILAKYTRAREREREKKRKGEGGREKVRWRENVTKGREMKRTSDEEVQKME